MSGLVYVDPSAAEQLQCPLCMDVFTDPVIVCRNEHHLCRQCAETASQRTRDERKCPECRRKLHIGNGQRFLKNMLDQLRVYCPNRERGCQLVLKREDLKAHACDCPNALIKCQWCEASMERQLLALTHYHCDAARFGCEFVTETDEMVAVHMATCPVSKCRRMFESYERQIEDLRLLVVPSGAILPWSGIVSEVPSGWALCDGQDGRPDRTFDFEEAPDKKRRRCNSSHRDVRYSLAYIIRHADVQVTKKGNEEEEEDDDLEGEESEESDYDEDIFAI